MTASATSSTSRFRKGRALEALFGVSPADFHARVAGRRVLLRHGPAARFDALLGKGRMRGVADIAALIESYGDIIETMRFDKRRVLQRLTVRGRGFALLTQRPERCHFFFGYDRHFRGARVLGDGLHAALGATAPSSHCRGSLQTPGAFVPRHSDDLDVVVLQLAGTRQWRIEPNGDPPEGLYDPVRWPKRMRGGWSADFGERGKVYTLRPGSALYVPYGWWHETRSEGLSFAVTYGFEVK